MKEVLFRLKAYLWYRLVAHHRRGFGVQSPFVFYLLNFVIFERLPFYSYRPIERLRSALLKDDRRVYVSDYGIGKSGDRIVEDVARRSLETPKYGQLLFRLVNHFHPQTILEMGTSLGVSTLYLAKPSRRAMVITMEGAESIAEIAKENFGKLQVNNVRVEIGNIDECLQNTVDEMERIDFVYIDANHTYDAVKKYFSICLQKSTNHSIFVLDDIHHSRGMEQAWDELRALPNVHLSIDLFHMGLLFFESSVPKQHYVVAF